MLPEIRLELKATLNLSMNSYRTVCERPIGLRTLNRDHSCMLASNTTLPNATQYPTCIRTVLLYTHICSTTLTRTVWYPAGGYLSVLVLLDLHLREEQDVALRVESHAKAPCCTRWVPQAASPSAPAF